MTHTSSATHLALAALASAWLATASAAPTAANPGHRMHYRLVDVGSFGGPLGLFSNPGSRVVNRHGMAAGMNSTKARDPYKPNCFYDCRVDHAFVWKDGVTDDLGALAGGVSSFPYAINDHGSIVGVSQNGTIDPATGYPETRGIIWTNNQIADLGTLGGTQSAANAINRQGRITGVSLTTHSDAFANLPQAACLWLPNLGSDCQYVDFAFNALFTPSTTKTHAVRWSKGIIHRIGTLGGPDSTAIAINSRNQIVGWSYTSYTAGASGVPDTHPFLWENGHMTDLGSLGGTVAAPSFLNENGQVVGASNLAGDTVLHPFIWDSANGMRDLGTLGGTYAHPDWLNDNGDVVGYSTTGDQLGRAFYWHNGVMTNLGTIGDDEASEAFCIDNRGQIVGLTFVRGGDDLRGFISDNGGALVDLNTLIDPGAKLRVISAVSINDRGEIVGVGQLANGKTRAIVLIPDDGQHAAANGKGGPE